MYREHCKIISNERLAHNYYKLVFFSENIAQISNPGQFVHVKIDNNSTDPLLRRPISINSIKENKISLIYKVVGKGTNVLTNLIPNDKIDVLGPLGNGFDLELDKFPENIIIVGGGVGIAPLLYLAEFLSILSEKINIYCFLGARQDKDLICLNEYESLENVKLFICTEDGSVGEKGYVTSLLETHLKEKLDIGKDTFVYACGPEIMLSEVGKTASKYKVKDIFVSMENRMGCGVGVCLGCVIDTVRGKERVCKEGPVFRYKDVVWKKTGDGHQFLENKKIGDGHHFLDMRVSIKNCNFKNPVITASGTFGYGDEYENILDVSKLGGITVKGMSLEAWEGNENYRLVETPSGLINAIGLQNMGVDDFILNKMPKIRELDTNIIVNISEHDVKGYKALASKLSVVKGIDAFEVNISCPNISKNGMAFGQDAEEAYKVIEAVRKETDLPVIAKLTPNVTLIADIALACEQAGADAISLINTVLAMAIDIKTKKPLLGNIMGGLSGPAIRPIAVRMVWQVYEKCKIPIIGMGGINSAQDAIEFILAGASIVACGTGMFVNPDLAIDVICGIEEYMRENGFSSVNDMVGIAH